MKHIDVKKFMEDFKEITDKNSPAILTGLAVFGFVATVVMVYKKSPKIHKKVKEAKKDLALTDQNDKEAKASVIIEAVKDVAPDVLPPLVLGGMSIGCIIASNRISSKRIAVLSTAYTFTEKTLRDYQNKTEELLGKKKSEQIKDSLMKDKLDSVRPIESCNGVVVPGSGDVLCFDPYSGRYFSSNAQKIGQAINRLSADCAQEMFVSLNDLYDLIKLPPVKLGDDIGFNANQLVMNNLPIDYHAHLTDDNIPVLCLEFQPEPRMDYRHLL